MKTHKIKTTTGRNHCALRAAGLAAMLVCAGLSAQTSQAQLNTDQPLQTGLQQLSTGLQINSALDNPMAGSSAYVWQTVAPGVLALSYTAPLQSANQDQQLLQSLMGGDSAAANISTLTLANQSIAGQPALTSVAALQGSVQQSVLKLFSENSLATASAQPLQSASSDQLSLNLVSQSLQTQVATLEVANQLPTAMNLVKAGLAVSPSTSISLNQAVAPTLLNAKSLVLQLIQNNDGYDNTLGLNTAGLSINNASVAALMTDPASQQILQSPLSPANFVTVGQLSQASALNFFNLSQSMDGNNSLSLAKTSALGLDGLFSTSVVALNNLNSPCLFVIIQDQWGAETQDYNSAVLAVNIGQANVQGLCATPEPSLCLTLGGFLAVALGAKRRLNRPVRASAA